MLVVSFATSTLTLAAQEKIEPTPSPFARAITREAARLAAEPMSSTAESVQQRGTLAAESSWSRVPKVKPGSEIVLTVKGSQSERRFFVQADASELTVLNLTDPALPGAAKLALRDIASRHPDYFATPGRSGSFRTVAVRVESGGVFVGDQKVADLGQIVERIARTDVVEITREGSNPFAPES